MQPKHGKSLPVIRIFILAAVLLPITLVGSAVNQIAKQQAEVNRYEALFSEAWRYVASNDRRRLPDPPAYIVKNDNLANADCCWKDRHFVRGGGGPDGTAFSWGLVKGSWTVVYIAPLSTEARTMRGWGGAQQVGFIKSLKEELGTIGAKLVVYRLNDVPWLERNNVFLGHDHEGARAYDYLLVNGWKLRGSGSERIFQQMLWVNEHLLLDSEWLTTIRSQANSHWSMINALKQQWWPRYVIVDPGGRVAAVSSSVYSFQIGAIVDAVERVQERELMPGKAGGTHE